MKRSFTPYLIPIFLFLLPTQYAFKSMDAGLPNGPVILLESTAERHWVKLEGIETKVTICGLEVGASYHLQVSDRTVMNSCVPNLKANPIHLGDTELLGTFNNGIHLKATANCFTIRAEVNAENCPQPKGDFMLSIAQQNAQTPQSDGFAPAIATVPGTPVSTLIQNFLIGGDCYDISNITDAGSANQKGSFSNGGTSIGFDTGVILSSGNVNVATGPNNQTGASTDEPNSATDVDLAQIVGGGLLNDVAKIEFDITPTVDTIRFNYVFASEEYCDFTNSSFNDVFGFFISGPGIAGPFSNGAENIAVIPGSATPVTINNVNHTLNQAYYVGNIPAGSGQLANANCAGHPVSGPPATSDCQFDGYTVSLTAEAVVIPCSTYHIKLAIADVLDGIYDSAVFFEANSLDVGGETKVDAVGSIAGTNIAYEGCTGAYFEFIRDDLTDLSQPQVINFTISVLSTATNGTDYVTIPLSVTIPAGQTSVQLPIDAFADGIAEGPETIILELDSPCTCESSTIEMIIDDPPEITTPLEDVTICEGQVPINLDGTATGGIPTFMYNWSTGSSNPSISVSPTSDETYYVTITDDCGNTTVDSASVTIIPMPSADMVGSGTFCENGGPATIDISVSFMGVGPWEFVYTVNGVPQPPIITTDNPYILTVDAAATYALQTVTAGTSGCPGSVTSNVNINEITLSPNLTPVDPLCNGDANGAITLTVSGGDPMYTYQWDNGAGTDQNPIDLPAGTYSVTITDANGCTETATTTINEPPVLDVTISSSQDVDCNNPSGSISTSVSGGTPNYIFDWSDGSSNPDAGNLPPGTYDVTVTDANGCMDVAQATINEDITPPNAAAAADGLLTCTETSITIDGNGSSTGAEFTYNWTGPGIVSGGTTLNPEVNAPGTYTITVTNTDNGCTETATVDVGQDITPPIAVGTADPITCNDPTIIIDGVGSSTGSEFSYNWTGPGIVTGGTTLNPEVNAPGTYTLTVTNTDNGCDASVNVTVPDDTTPPNAVANAGDLTCVVLALQINGNGSSVGPEYGYSWSTNDGNIVSGETTLTPTVDAPGTYTLDIIDNSNGCVNTVSVVVGLDNILPTVDAGPPAEINCANPTVTLTGGSNPTGPGASYNWSTSNGQIIGSNANINATVSEPGTYTLTVTNVNNGCVNSDDVVVTENVEQPLIAIAPADLINCYVPEVTLDGTGSSTGTEFSYSWIGPGIVSGGTTLNPVVNQPGLYTLIINNNDNFCNSQLSVVVPADLGFPIASAGPPMEITCNQTELTLLGLGSSSGPEYTYDWTTATGNIISGADTPTPLVNEPGIYVLTVLNTINGCESTSQVEVTVDAAVPQADAGPNQQLDCLTTLVTLDGTNSTVGGSVTYEWVTLDGNILSGAGTLTPLVNAPGTYELQVTNSDNGCVAISTAIVIEDVEVPIVFILPPAQISCDEPTIVLDASNSSTNGNLDYTWLTGTGNIVSGQGTLTPTVDAAGTYILNISNADNFCSSSNAVIVVDITDDPIIAVAPPETLTCGITEIDIDGTGSESGPNFEIEWTTLDGNITSGGDGLMPTVDLSGTYTLTITDISNNCVSTTDVIVPADLDLPIVDAGLTDELNCAFEELTLSGSAAGSPNLDIIWSTPDGNIISGEDGLNPLIDQPGTYIIEVLNEDNECSSEDQVEVTQDVILPIVEAGPGSEINCYQLVYDLDASGSDVGAPFNYQWSTANGNIVSGATTANPTVDAGGTYTLTIINTANFCLDSASVSIAEDLIFPQASAGADDVINCYALELNLDGNASEQGPAIEYAWTTPDGNIISGEDSTNPLIDQPGTYELTVTNTDNGCVSTDDALVEINLINPVVDAGPGDELTCTMSTIQLMGDALGNIAGFEYEWQTLDGNILSGANTLDPIVDAPGLYTLVVIDLDNGCSEDSDVEVTQDANLPTALINPDSAINCVNNLITLDGTASSQSPTITFEWQVSNGGNILSGDNTLTPIVDAAGQYTLIIYDSSNDCTDQTSLNIEPDTINPIIALTPPAILTCDLTALDLDAQVVSNSGNYGVNWNTANGNIVSGGTDLDPTIDAPGIYSIQVIDNINGCESSAEIEILEDIVYPDVSIEDPLILDCNVGEFSLEGSYETGGIGVLINWSTIDGSILDGDTTLTPLINAPGTYTLAIENEINGCLTTLSIPVDQDIVAPTVDAGPPDILNCDITQLNLNGLGSSQGGDFDYTWSTPDGNILGGASSLDPLIDAPGIYVLEILNTINGCTDLDSTLVNQDIILPDVDAGPPGLLTCTILDYQLQGTGDVGGSFEYIWTTTDGNIQSGADQLDAIVNDPGTYVLEIINISNGCESFDTVEVVEDVLLPDAITENAAILTCVLTEQNLSGLGSSVGVVYTYQWSTTDGNILSGANTLDPQVNAPGTYMLEVTNTDNGCVNSEPVVVDQDILPPAADAGAPETLTCTITELALSGVGSSQGPEFIYQWSTLDGNILSGENSINPQIDAPGTYEIVVTDLDNGCINDATVTIDQDIIDPEVIIASPETLTCELTSQMLDASNSSLGDYEWTTLDGNIQSGANGPNPTVNEPGTYSLQITNPDNGCISNLDILVDQNVIFPEAEAGPMSEITCIVTSLNLNGTATGNGPILEIEWTTQDGNIVAGGNSENPLIDAPGTYTITVTDLENGCATTDVVDVIPNNETPLVAAADPAILNCLITEIQLDASASESGSDIAYSWTTSNGSILTDPNLEIITIDEPGTYSFEVLNTYTGCSDDLILVVDQDIEAPVVDAGDEWILPCNEDFIDLNGTASAPTTQLMFDWNTTGGSIISGAQSLQPSVNAGGTYELIVTNLENGCSSSDFTEVTEVKPEDAFWDPESPLCIDDFGVLVAVDVIGGTPPYVYSIDGGETFNTTNIFLPLEPGTYDVVVQDALGCEVEGVEVIYNPQEVLVDLEPRVELQFGDTYQLNALTNLVPGEIGSVEWFPSNTLSCSDCLDPLASPLETTEYEVTITDINGCQAEGRILLVVDRDPAIYIPNVFSPDGDGNNDLFMIFAKSGTVKEVQSFLVFSRWGETVFEYYQFEPNNPAYGWDGHHRGQPLNPAVFAWFAIVEFIDGRVELFEGDVTLVR